MASTQTKFCRLVKSLGGTTKAAKHLGCSAPMVSLIKTKDRNPGRDLANRIEKASAKGVKSNRIRAAAWV